MMILGRMPTSNITNNTCKNLTYPNLIEAVAPDFFLIGTTSKKQDGH
ncbi:hypothetical protein SAMN04488511_108206 [Pedobacter suwonensis]|uniref:Uncharacterized protein n=1 Tax=Pedobacter suwonensis TaxID=332999 RepID=A0A1I0TDJ2_9SPHI|nr:hypothetical protein SAMN04488511_108206 [Pedobacter suwonensis]